MMPPRLPIAARAFAAARRPFSCVPHRNAKVQRPSLDRPAGKAGSGGRSGGSGSDSERRSNMEELLEMWKVLEEKRSGDRKTPFENWDKQLEILRSNFQSLDRHVSSLKSEESAKLTPLERWCILVTCFGNLVLYYFLSWRIYNKDSKAVPKGKDKEAGSIDEAN